MPPHRRIAGSGAYSFMNAAGIIWSAGILPAFLCTTAILPAVSVTTAISAPVVSIVPILL